ncbi:MAG: hypothetical protein H6706_07825 [Myxococcales bacterium]|nr:hypothetical protein [Myxococcales bacterium]
MRSLLFSALALGGCQLVIGDIELPRVETPEGGVADQGEAPDWALDAAPVDAAPPRDRGVVDAAWDAARPVDAAPPMDAAPPQDAAWPSPDAGPAVDVSALAGVWHVYGLQGRDRDVSMFVAALRVAADGSATVTTLESEEPLAEGATPFTPHPDGSPRVSLNLFPVAGLLVGALDPVTGLGVLVNDQDRMSTQPIFALASRQGPEQMWPGTALYAQLTVRPTPDAAELGLLQGPGPAQQFSQYYRVQASPAMSLPDATLFREADTRTRFSSDDGRGFFVYSSTDRGVGGPGELAANGDRYGIALALAAGGRPAAVDRAYFCGGPYFDVANAFAVSRSRATLALGGERPTLELADGRQVVLGVPVSDVYPLDTQRGFFHRAGGSLAIGPGGRALMLVDADLPAGRGQWAMGLCVTVDP